MDNPHPIDADAKKMSPFWRKTYELKTSIGNLIPLMDEWKILYDSTKETLTRKELCTKLDINNLRELFYKIVSVDEMLKLCENLDYATEIIESSDDDIAQQAFFRQAQPKVLGVPGVSPAVPQPPAVMESFNFGAEQDNVDDEGDLFFPINPEDKQDNEYERVEADYMNPDDLPDERDDLPDERDDLPDERDDLPERETKRQKGSGLSGLSGLFF